MTTAKRPYDAIVYIGRFQPLHIGHEHVIKRALELANKVIVLVGSANEAISIKNPWTFGQRQHMVHDCFRYEATNGRLIVAPLDNHPSDLRWVRAVRDAVETNTHDDYRDYRIAITGFAKDDSSAYLRWFPEWTPAFIDVQVGTFNATDIRHAYFQPMPILPRDVCPQPIIDYLLDFRLTEQFRVVMEEKAYLDHYRSLWHAAPFNRDHPHAITADCVVEQNKQVLLVTRKSAPGAGLLALPGGHLDWQDKSLRDCAIRELREETAISDARGRIPAGRLGDYIREDRTKLFDDPNRDLRGRYVTQAFYFGLPDGPQFKVKGDDDAAHAQWYPIGPGLKPTMFYADHYHILSHFFGL